MYIHFVFKCLHTTSSFGHLTLYSGIMKIIRMIKINEPHVCAISESQLKKPVMTKVINTFSHTYKPDTRRSKRHCNIKHGFI